MNNHVFQIDNGIKGHDTTFNVRVVFKGGRYGLDDCLTHQEDDPLIEFYDINATKKKDGLGYFVARYNASTLLSPERNQFVGLLLDTGSPQWRITGEALSSVLAEIKDHIDEVKVLQAEPLPSM